MPFEFIEETPTSQGFPYIEEPKGVNSEKQKLRTAIEASLAEQNLKPTTDFNSLFEYNKQTLDEGKEDLIRDNISAIEQLNNINNQRELFVEGVANGDSELAQGALDSAKNSSEMTLIEAIEFNALDTFREDDEETDSELLDKEQALIASQMLASKKIDAEEELGILDKAADIWVDLSFSARQNGGNIGTDVIKGLANGVPAALEGVADNINDLLPDAYWDLLSQDGDGTALRAAVMKEVDKDTLGKFSTGKVGDVVEVVSSFAVGMGAIATKIPKGTTLSLNALRFAAAGTLSDLAVLRGTETAIPLMMDLFPSTKAPVTEWLADRQEDSPWENKSKQAIEAAGLNLVGEGVVFGAIKIFRGLKALKSKVVPFKKIAEDPIKMVDTLGNKEDAASIAREVIADDTGIHPLVKESTKVEDAVEAATPTLLKTSLDIKPDVGLSGATTVKEVQDQALQTVEEIQSLTFGTDRLQGEELQAAITKTKEEIVGLYPDNMIADIRMTKENNVHVANIYLGKKGTGTGYKTEQAARNQAEGLKVDIIKTDTGMYYPVHKKVVTETGFTQPVDFTDTSIIAKNEAVRFIVEPAEFLPDHLLDDIGIASNARATIRRQLIDPLVKRYTKKVSKEDFKTVNDIAAIGRDTIVDQKGRTGKWFTRDEFDVHYKRLRGENSNDKAWDSYKAYREINDTQYALENSNEYIRKATMGMEEIKINLSEFEYSGNGIVKSTLTATDSFRVYSPSDNKIFNKGELRSSNLLEEYKDYKVIQLENTTQIKDSKEVIKYLLVKPSDMKVNPLDPFQVNYRAGGRVIYKGKWFSKQAKTSKAGDGSTINENPLTHYTSENRRELVEHTSRLENARTAYKSIIEAGEDGEVLYYPVSGINKDGTFQYSKQGKLLTKTEAEDIISKTALVDFENMSKAVEDGMISLKHPFEVRGDREIPLAYNTANSSYIDENHTGAASWLTTNKKKKFASRGERLLNPQEKLATVLDPQQAIEKSIGSIINYGLSGDYTKRIANQFTATAKAQGYLKQEFKEASPELIFSKGRDAIEPNILGEADPDYQALLTTLDSMQRGLGYKSTLSKIKDRNVEKLVQYFDHKNLSIEPAMYDKAGNLIESKISKGLRKTEEFKALQKANNILYTTQFGLNAAQYFTQGVGGFFTTTLQDPLKAMQSMGSSIFSSLGHIDKNITKSLGKNKQLMNLIGFDNGKEFEHFVNFKDKTGYIEVHQSQIDIAKQKAATGKSGRFFDILDTMWDKSTIAMETGEMLNQNTAFRVAYLRYKDLYGVPKIDDSRAAGWIMREADKLTFNMKSSIQSNLSKNELSGVIMRFKNFFWKVFQATTVGGKRSAKDKAKFWATTTAVFGTGTNMYTEWAKGKLGVEDPKIIQLMENGAANFFFTDDDGEGIIDISNTIDPRGISSVFADMTDPDTKLIHWATGALGAKSVQIWDSGKNAARFMSEVFYQPDRVLPLTQEALVELSKISTGWTNTMRGYHAFNTGNLYSRSEVPLVDGMSKAEALTTMFGFKTPQEMAVYNNYGLLRDQNRVFDDTAKTIFQLYQRASKEDISTEAGLARYDMFTSLAERLLNTPHRDEIEKRINKRDYFASSPQVNYGKETLQERRETKRDFEEFDQ
jgi:hypothetical protein